MGAIPMASAVADFGQDRNAEVQHVEMVQVRQAAPGEGGGDGEGRSLEDRAHAAMRTCPRFVLLDFRCAPSLHLITNLQVGFPFSELEVKTHAVMRSCPSFVLLHFKCALLPYSI